MTAEEPALDGRCTCGAVRYRVRSAPLIVHCCHCRWCQRESGAAFAVNAMIEADRLERLAGDVVENELPTLSGRGQIVVRCSSCRVVLWSHYGGLGRKACFVRVGTLDEPEKLPPDAHIYTASKQPWVVLPDNVPCFEEYYRRSLVWSQQSLARLEALKN